MTDQLAWNSYLVFTTPTEPTDDQMVRLADLLPQPVKICDVSPSGNVDIEIMLVARTLLVAVRMAMDVVAQACTQAGIEITCFLETATMEQDADEGRLRRAGQVAA